MSCKVEEKLFEDERDGSAAFVSGGLKLGFIGVVAQSHGKLLLCPLLFLIFCWSGGRSVADGGRCLVDGRGASLLVVGGGGICPSPALG